MEAMVQTKPKTAWSRFINDKYEEWRKGKTGHAAGVSAFGRQFGAPHQVVLAWLEPDSRPPVNLKYVNRIIDVYGDEAYGPLGIDKIPRVDELDERKKRLLDLIEQTPADKQDELIELVEQFLRFAGFRRVE